MRKREITWQGWRVSWPDVDGGRHSVTADEREDAVREARALRKVGVADVRVRPVTRYRLAPLVEIAAWHKSMWGEECGGEDAGATVNGSCVRVWSNVSGTVRVSRAPRGQGRREAKAALAWLGFRVAR